MANKWTFIVCALAAFLFGRYSTDRTETQAPKQQLTPLEEELIFQFKPKLLHVGILSSPANFANRKMLRKFHKKVSPKNVHYEFVFGNAFAGSMPTRRLQERVAREIQREKDVVFVDAREKLPHVGKVTEKSSAWWQSAPKRVNARFYCKTDDDSLIHHERLRDVLLAAEEQAATPYIIASYIRWRGWIPEYHFQACGGGWGGPSDAWKQMLDPKQKCERAEGPFPQGTGTLTCMSSALAQDLSKNPFFADWHTVAKVRNDYGESCKTPAECAAQPFSTHMWHHEDAGISYNIWKTVNRFQRNTSIVHFPEKGWFWPWFSEKLAEPKMSSRALIVHKVKPNTVERVKGAWDIRAPHPKYKIDCSQTCAQWGWKNARKPCDEEPALPASFQWRGFSQRWNGSLCSVDIASLFRCCFLTAE